MIKSAIWLALTISVMIQNDAHRAYLCGVGWIVTVGCHIAESRTTMLETDLQPAGRSFPNSLLKRRGGDKEIIACDLQL